MGTKFLYIKVNDDNDFANTINPQLDNVIVYLSKDINDNLIWKAKDQNGNIHVLGSTTDVQISLAQVTNISENDTSVNTLGFDQSGNPSLNTNSISTGMYNFAGVPIILYVTLYNQNQQLQFELQNVNAVGNNRVWNYNNVYKIYYNNAYYRWNLQDLTNDGSSVLDYTIETQQQPYDSNWNNGSVVNKNANK